MGMQIMTLGVDGSAKLSRGDTSKFTQGVHMKQVENP